MGSEVAHQCLSQRLESRGKRRMPFSDEVTLQVQGWVSKASVKLEMLSVIWPNLQSHFSTCIYQLLFALLCPSPFQPRSPRWTAFHSWQNALQTFSLGTYHSTVKLAEKGAPVSLWRWRSWSTESLRGLLKVTQSSRSWTKLSFLGLCWVLPAAGGTFDLSCTLQDL